MNKSSGLLSLFESESELYRLIVETANEGIWLIDENDLTSFVNQKMADILGCTIDQMIGETIFCCMDEEGEIKAKRGLLERKKGISSSHEFKLFRKDGTELWTHMNVSPVFMEGEYKGTLAMVTDITAIRERDIVEEESLQTYNALFEESPIPLWEEDFSEVKKHIDQLKENGITNFREYFENNPKMLLECSSKLVVNNINQAVVDLNEAASKEEVLAGFPKLLNRRSSEYAIAQLEAIASNKNSCEFDAEFKTLNGNVRYVHFKWSVVKGYEHNYGKVYLSTTDLTERIVQENISLQNTNRQKEMLLKEIHHRVKNNLQIISSLLNLQMNDVEDKEIQNVLAIGLNRVKSMATVHEMLYKSDDFTGIDYNDYLDSFVTTLVESYKGNEHNIDLEFNTNGIKLNINTSVPLGLMVNEIVSNSLKHGIKDDQPGSISIKMQALEYPKFVMTISDSGPGIPKEFQNKLSDTLGMQLIEGLTEQLNGTVEFLNNGTGYRIEFEELSSSNPEV